MARSMEMSDGAKEELMELVEMYLGLPPDGRMRARQLLEDNFSRPADAKAA